MQLGCTPVQLATRRNHEDIVQYLCEQGCQLDIRNVVSESSFHVYLLLFICGCLLMLVLHLVYYLLRMVTQ